MTGRTGVRPAQPCITLGFVRRIHLHQTRGDCVTIDVRADLERMAAWAAALVVMASLNVWLGAPLWLLALDAVVLPVIVIGLRRAATRRHRTLVRAQGRLLLDGEPLEMARVELRVRNWPLTKVPRGYSLSLSRDNRAQLDVNVNVTSDGNLDRASSEAIASAIQRGLMLDRLEHIATVG